MVDFHYRALDAEGEVKTGQLAAMDKAAATAEIRRRGFVPVELSQSGKTLAMRLNEPVHLFNKPGQRDVFAFMRDLARLLRAGLPMDDALKLLLQMQRKELFIGVLEDIREQVRQGESLAASLSRHKELFSVQSIAAVQAGEMSGTLPETLDTVSESMDRSLSFQERLKSALIYPTILVVMVVATFVLVVTFVLPQFAPLFEGNEDKLPAMTRFVMAMASVFSEFFWLIGLAFVGLVAWAIWAAHNETAKRSILQGLCKLPLIKDMLIVPDMVRFIRTVGVCSRSGLALDRAIAMAIDAVKMPHLMEELVVVRTTVRRGEALSQCLAKVAWFPPLALQFAKVGEQSGNLGTMLEEAASLLSQDYESKLEKSLETLSPLLTLVMGGIVALLVGSVLLGIMSINDVAL